MQFAFTPDHAHIGARYQDPPGDEQSQVEWVVLDVDSFEPTDPDRDPRPLQVTTDDGPFARCGGTYRALVARVDYGDVSNACSDAERRAFERSLDPDHLPGVRVSTHMVGAWTAGEMAAAQQRRLHAMRDVRTSTLARNQGNADTVAQWAADLGLVPEARDGQLSLVPTPSAVPTDFELLCAENDFALRSPILRISVPLDLFADLVAQARDVA